MTEIVGPILALLQTLLPLINNSSTVSAVIKTLVDIIPPLVREAQDLVPVVKNIVAALRENPASTEEQLAQLAALDAKVDAEFEAAAAAALTEDNQS